MKKTFWGSTFKQSLVNKNSFVLFVLAILVTLFFSVLGCGGGVGSDPFPNPAGPETFSWADNIAEVQAAIAADPNANWVAGQTWVTKQFANVDEAKVLLGDLPVNFPENRNSFKLFQRPVATFSQELIPSDKLLKTSVMPISFSWLEKDGKNWMTSVKNQGRYGTCVAFAVCGTLESRLNIISDFPNDSIDLSEWYLWFKMTDGKNPTIGGWSIFWASDFLKSNGVVEEFVMPYSLIEQYPSFAEPPQNAQKYGLVD